MLILPCTFGHAQTCSETAQTLRDCSHPQRLCHAHSALLIAWCHLSNGHLLCGQDLVRAYPPLLGCDAASAGAVVACLAGAGLTRAELERVLRGWPKVLLMECASSPASS